MGTASQKFTCALNQLGGVPPWARLSITTGVVVIVTGLLLAYTQGISLRTAKRALSADSPSPPPAIDAAVDARVDDQAAT